MPWFRLPPDRQRSCWETHKNGWMLRELPRPSGVGALGAAFAVHVCAVTVPALPHEWAALLGAVAALILQRWVGRWVLALANLGVVPLVAWFSSGGAVAIGQVDRTYLPTFVVLVAGVLIMLLAGRLYTRQSKRLILPRLWQQTTPSKKQKKN